MRNLNENETYMMATDNNIESGNLLSEKK